MAEIIVRQDGKIVVQAQQVSSGSGLPLPTGNDGFAIIELGSVIAFRAIKASYIQATFAISSFSANTSVVEVNSSVVTPAFTAAYVRTPTTALLDDDEGSTQKDVTSTPTAFASNETFSKTVNNDSVQFTLSADDGEDPVVQAFANVAWQPRTFFGVDVDGLSTEADIESLSNQQLDNNRNITFTVAPGAGQHIYYAFPSSYGTPTFTIGGFEGGFVLQAAAVSVTNAFGNTQDYDLWKSINANLGSTTVVVT